MGRPGAVSRARRSDGSQNPGTPALDATRKLYHVLFEDVIGRRSGPVGDRAIRRRHLPVRSIS